MTVDMDVQRCQCTYKLGEGFASGCALCIAHCQNRPSQRGQRKKDKHETAVSVVAKVVTIDSDGEDGEEVQQQQQAAQVQQLCDGGGAGTKGKARAKV